MSKIVTGHNADDIAETVIMNILRFTEKLLPKLSEICFIEVKMKLIVLLLRILRQFSLEFGMFLLKYSKTPLSSLWIIFSRYGTSSMCGLCFKCRKREA